MIPAWAVASLRHRVPQNWRGTAREREIRELVINVVEQATRAEPDGYDRWCESLQRLYDQGVDDRLRGMVVSELRMLIEEGAQGPLRPVTADAAAQLTEAVRYIAWVGF